MLFARIKHQMSVAEFRIEFPEIKIAQPTTFSEKLSGREIVYKLTFENDLLSRVQINLNGDFTESEYLDITAIALSLIEAQAGRGIDATAVESTLLPWKDLIQSPLPDSGKPDERYIEALKVSWPVLGWSISLSFTWTWPGQLTLEYHEAKI
jgi:hypothetical protein